MLDVTFCVKPGREKDAVLQFYAAARRPEWLQLVALAAEVVTLQERLATGQIYLVAPVHREHLAAVVQAR